MNNSGHLDNNKKNKDGIKRTFLKALADGFSITYASKVAGIGRSTAYYWRDRDPKFAQVWDDAHEQGIDWFEDRLREAASLLNVTAILAKLNAERSDKYRHTTKVEHTGIVRHAHHDMSRFTDEELDGLLELANRYSGGESEAATG